MAGTTLTRPRRATVVRAQPKASWRRTWPLLVASVPILVFLLVPLLALLLRIDLGRLLANLANPEVAQAIGLSMLTRC